MLSEPARRVLVVDDDERIRKLLESRLSARGLAVDAVADGGEAIDALHRARYSVVLLDLVMPRVDGFAVIEWIQENRRLLQPQPVLLLLTGAEPRFPGDLDAETVHGILRKPFDPNELASLVAACAEAKVRSSLQAMALAAMVSAQLLVFLTSR